MRVLLLLAVVVVVVVGGAYGPQEALCCSPVLLMAPWSCGTWQQRSHSRRGGQQEQQLQGEMQEEGEGSGVRAGTGEQPLEAHCPGACGSNVRIERGW